MSDTNRDPGGTAAGDAAGDAGRDADGIPSDVEPPDADDDTHTEGGAPTDKAHEEVGDGSLTGSVPAGLTVSEMQEFMTKGGGNEGGTG